MLLLKRLINGPWIPGQQNKPALAWLLMLVFFIWKYAEHPASTTELCLAALSMVAFLGFYFASFWFKNKTSIVLMLAICLIGLAWAPFNWGSSVFIVFAAASCGAIQPIKRAYCFLGLVLALVTLESATLKLPTDFWVPAIVVSTAIGFATITQMALRRSNQQLLRSQEEVAHIATIAERERISRDLHDLLGHTLTLITIKAELAGKLAERDLQACKNEISDIEQSARNALSEVRAAVTGYRQIGFTHELATAASLLRAAGIDFTTHISEIKLSAASENILTLCLREASTNVARHSQATQCSIHLNLVGNWIVFEVNDNGKAISANAKIELGNGLLGMNERITGLGGQLNIDVTHGLSLRIHIPKDPIHNKEQGTLT